MPCVVDVHAQSCRFFAQTRHSHDVPREDDEETRARGRSDAPDLEGPPRRRAEGALVVAQAELRLRDADRQAVEACGPEPLEVLEGRGVVLHSRGAVDRRGDLGDLLLERVRVLVDEPHRMGRGLRRIDHEAAEFLPARAAIFVERVRGRPDAEVLAMVDDRVDLAIRVRQETVHRDDRGHAEGLQDPHVGVEVDQAGLEGLRILGGEVLALRAAVMLEGADAHDEHRGVRSRRALRSGMPSARQRIAITSLAAVMMKPSSRGTPCLGPPRPVTMFRSCRSFMSRHRGNRTRVGSMSISFPWKMCASRIAAIRLFAAPTAWMSPVKWRLISSIGRTWARPPPVAPPFVPKTGPRDGSRTATIPFVPRRFRAWPRPTVVRVFPSP